MKNEIYNVLPEAKEFLNEMKNLYESQTEEFDNLFKKIKDLVVSKKLNWDDFIKTHIYFFMDIACKIKHADFVYLNLDLVESPKEFYEETGRFDYRDEFSDYYFSELIMEQLNKENGFEKFGSEAFDPVKVENIVFSFYTGFKVEEYGEEMYINEQVNFIDYEFELVLLEKALEEEFGDVSDMIEYLNDSDELPTSMIVLGGYIEDGKIKFKDPQTLTNQYAFYNICDYFDYELQFKFTNIRDEDEGVYYVQYKYDEDIDYKFTKALAQCLTEKNK